MVVYSVISYLPLRSEGISREREKVTRIVLVIYIIHRATKQALYLHNKYYYIGYNSLIAYTTLDGA